MPRHQFSNDEKNLLKVIKNETDYIQDTSSLMETTLLLNTSIAESETLLQFVRYGDKIKDIKIDDEIHVQKTLVVRSFDDLLLDANKRYPNELSFEDIFTQDEVLENTEYIRRLSYEFAAIHKLDLVDIAIPVVAGILSGAINCALGGFVKRADGRNVPGSMSDFVNNLFDKALPQDRIKKLEELAKVPYDALNYDNRGNIIVQEIVSGLSPLFHHEVSLGHDPILGFIFGTLDMLRGTVTTLDFNGKFLIQVAEGFSDRKAQNIFHAIATVFLHMLSDVNGSSSAKNGGMGLPVPFVALFNNFQFGKAGDNDTISELIKSMFYQGYDFRHFCSMSVPVMITEVIVRVSYFAKRLHEGYTFSEAIPIGISHTKNPKLETMLFIAHSASTAINTGKVAFTKNPLNINYPQWLSFAKYSMQQLKWALIEKPALRDKYIMGVIDDEWEEILADIDAIWNSYSRDSAIVYVQT